MKSRKAFSIERIRPRFKVWLCNDAADGLFGGGKWRLLDAIHRTGSLRAAAESLGISYRKAWGDLRKAESGLGIKFLERRRGGSDGGETRLTETGERWLLEYGRFQKKVEQAVARAFDAWVERIRR